MITIFQAEWCSYSRAVRAWISDNLNDIPLIFISVPRDKDRRLQLKEKTGQLFIPSLIDDEADVKIVDSAEEIISYLAAKYKKDSEVEYIADSMGEACLIPRSNKS